jgi:hypothetical protein
MRSSGSIPREAMSATRASRSSTKMVWIAPPARSARFPFRVVATVSAGAQITVARTKSESGLKEDVPVLGFKSLKRI